MRAELFLPQCENPHRTRLSEIGDGLTLLCFGIFEKTVLADGVCAPVADSVYSSGAATAVEAWAGTPRVRVPDFL